MTTAAYDLGYIKAGLEILEDYLLVSDIYWPIGVSAPAGESPYPQFTLGNLLLARQRADCSAQTPAQRVELDHLVRNLDSIRQEWLSAWRKKAGAEFHARLNLWRNFLEDYRAQPQAHHDRYAYEVNRRVLLHLLSMETKDLPKEQIDLKSGLDKLLHSILIPAAFIWDQKLAPSFPKETYWYLYGQLPTGR